MATDLACSNRARHAVLYLEEGVIEIKCDRGHCGAGRGKVVLHRWSLTTGELVSTKKYATPTSTKGRDQ